jgi:hypothetical protein
MFGPMKIMKLTVMAMRLRIQRVSALLILDSDWLLVFTTSLRKEKKEVSGFPRLQ